MVAKKGSDLTAVKKVINEIRPMLVTDGGDIELVSFKDGVVKVKLQGACSGYPMAAQTLKNGVEAMLKEKVNGVKSVVRVD